MKALHSLISSLVICGTAAWPALAKGLYYKLETVASHGSSTTAEGETITAFHRASINESGIVAFTADAEKGTTTLRRVYISGTTPDVPVALGDVDDNRTTGFAQINAEGKIAAWEGFLSGTPRHSLVRVWDALNPTVTPTYLTSTQTNCLTNVLSPVSIANDGVVLFPGFSPRQIFLNTNGVRDSKNQRRHDHSERPAVAGERTDLRAARRTDDRRHPEREARRGRAADHREHLRRQLVSHRQPAGDQLTAAR